MTTLLTPDPQELLPRFSFPFFEKAEIMSIEFNVPQSDAIPVPQPSSNAKQEGQESRENSPAVDKRKIARIRAILQSFSESSTAVVLRAAIAQLAQDHCPSLSSYLIGLDDEQDHGALEAPRLYLEPVAYGCTLAEILLESNDEFSDTELHRLFWSLTEGELNVSTITRVLAEKRLSQVEPARLSFAGFLEEVICAVDHCWRAYTGRDPSAKSPSELDRALASLNTAIHSGDSFIDSVTEVPPPGDEDPQSSAHDSAIQLQKLGRVTVGDVIDRLREYPPETPLNIQSPLYPFLEFPVREFNVVREGPHLCHGDELIFSFLIMPFSPGIVSR